MNDETQSGGPSDQCTDALSGVAADAGSDTEVGATPQSAADAGSLLAAWREQAGLTVADVASRLKLSARQVAALERNDWSAFASPALLKGFVRAYARVVQGDEAAALCLLPQVIDPSSTLSLEPTLSAPMPASRLHGNARWWLRSGIAGALVIGAAVVVGKFGWIPINAIQSSMHASTAPAQVSEALELAPKGNAPETPVAQGAAPDAQPPAATPETAAAPASAPATPAVAIDQSPGAPAPQVLASATPAGTGAGSTAVLRINVQNDSWIEITDAGGRVLLSALQPAGAQQDLSGRAPFTVVVGNAPGVHIEYAGKPVDLTPYTRGNVARFALN
jgi:cytoskeleton protein RodZ